MAGQAPRTRRELEAGLIERAAKDEAFRRALVADPKGTLPRRLAPMRRWSRRSGSPSEAITPTDARGYFTHFGEPTLAQHL